MKLLLLIIAFSTVSKSDCRHFSDEPASQAFTDETEKDYKQYKEELSTIEEQHLPVDRNLIGEEHYITFEPEIPVVDEGPQNHFNKKAPPPIVVEQNRQYERKNNKTSCKAKSTCDLLGGFCVTNTTLCSGRLVSGGCKGTKCHCCVPGNIEAKIESLKEDLQSINDNMNNSNYNMKTELKFLGDNINNKSANLSSDLRIIKNNINKSTLNLSLVVQSIDNMNTNLKSIAESLKDIAGGCPTSQGFFVMYDQCFKFLTDSQRTRDAANTRCQQLGLILAKPKYPLQLRSYMVNHYADKYPWVWLGARGTGSLVKWDSDGTTINSKSTLWWNGQPSSQSSSSYCLILMVYKSYLTSYPNQPFYMTACSGSNRWALCEKL